MEDFPFELDNENLKRVTGLKKLVGEKDTVSEEESEDEVVEYDDDAVGTGNKGGDIVSKEKEEVDERRNQRDVSNSVNVKGTAGVWTSFLGNIVIMLGD